MNAARIADEWQAALADAGFTPEQACLHVFEGTANPMGEGAFWVGPGDSVPRKRAPFEGDDDGFRRINIEQRELHRIVVWNDGERVLLAAEMRHELEHARQFDAHGPGLFALHQFVNAALDVKVRGLPGGAVVYSSFLRRLTPTRHLLALCGVAIWMTRIAYSRPSMTRRISCGR